MKDFFNKKNILVIIGIIVILVLIILLVILNPFGKKKSSENETVSKIKSKEDLINVINEVCNTYYQEYYYTLMDKEDLQKHEEFGINISLRSIGLAVSFSEDLETNLKKYECDQDATKIRYYPTSPFKQTDYTMKTNIVCNK